ncbi:MAG: hypothetical protein LH616_06420 [Ilumatobacteraceae bacterium]|nr:hypothetical protein [Ilumatobacteraceae bacterium]
MKSLVDMIAAHIHVKESVLATFDGPTLQHAIKQMNGERLRRLPRLRAEQPDRDLLSSGSGRSTKRPREG